MPHLTRTPVTASPASPVHTPTPLADKAVGLGVPGCGAPFHAPGEWAALTRPGAPVHWVALDLADDPGATPDDPGLGAAGSLRAAGVRVLGRLDAARGADGDLVLRAHRQLDRYGVDGFLLDRCPAGRDGLPGIRRVVTTLRALRDDAHIVLGHGTHPCPGYAENCDQMVTFDGSWADYRWSQAAEWTADYPPERFCHWVHGMPRGHLDEGLRIARWQGASTLWFTDRRGHPVTGGVSARGDGRYDADGGPRAALPGHWDDLVSRIGTGVSE
ncbi:phage tail protein [Streptomyces sp. NPDC090306]|uniref:phage tail protein n=1 Tax=Streptomyces sp. NPDC090306 TaxID=3365961 RepID=UPI003802B1BE